MARAGRLSVGPGARDDNVSTIPSTIRLANLGAYEVALSAE